MPSGRKRTFDYDEARARYAAGETQAEIGASLGVSAFAVCRAVNEAVRLRSNERVQAWGRAKRVPCAGGCGEFVWMQNRERTGLCRRCFAEKKRAVRDANPLHGTEGEYSRGCRCADCRAGATAAKRERREKSKAPCVHGCGRLVPTINRDRPDKPLECAQCSRKRVAAERRAG